MLSFPDDCRAFVYKDFLLIISQKHFFHILIVFEAVLWNFYGFGGQPFHKILHFGAKMWKSVRAMHGKFHIFACFFMILWNF